MQQIYLVLDIYSGLSLDDNIEPYLEGKKSVNIVPEFSKDQEFLLFL